MTPPLVASMARRTRPSAIHPRVRPTNRLSAVSQTMPSIQWMPARSSDFARTESPGEDGVSRIDELREERDVEDSDFRIQDVREKPLERGVLSPSQSFSPVLRRRAARRRSHRRSDGLRAQVHEVDRAKEPDHFESRRGLDENDGQSQRGQCRMHEDPGTDAKRRHHPRAVSARDDIPEDEHRVGSRRDREERRDDGERDDLRISHDRHFKTTPASSGVSRRLFSCTGGGYRAPSRQHRGAAGDHSRRRPACGRARGRRGRGRAAYDCRCAVR
jgi:hypothetical protein